MTKKILICLIALLMFVSCETAQTQPRNEDSERAVEAFKLAEGLRKAYSDKDMDSMKSLMSDTAFESTIRIVKPFDSVVLKFTPKHVDIDGDDIELTVAWDGLWKVGSKSHEEQGTVMFVISGSPMKVMEIKRTTPFAEPK